MRIARKELAAGVEVRGGDRTFTRPCSLATVTRRVARTSVYDADAPSRLARLRRTFWSATAERSWRCLTALAAMRLAQSGRNETQLNGRLGYDWVHSDDDGLFSSNGDHGQQVLAVDS